MALDYWPGRLSLPKTISARGDGVAHRGWEWRRPHRSAQLGGCCGPSLPSDLEFACLDQWRGPRAGPPLPGAPGTRGFIGSRPSRCIFLRASLRARRIASAFSRGFFSEGFS
jgi:hypothetical protein